MQNLNAEASTRTPAQSGVLIRAGLDRNDHHQVVLGGMVIDFKVTSRDNPGGLFVMEGTQTKRGGPPRHVHYEQDEYFYILEGRYMFEVGGDRFEVGPGDSLFGPRRLPHTFMFTGEGRGRMLIAYQPAGKMEAFFTALAARPGIPEPEELKDLFARHGMEITGAPLALSLI